MKTLIIEFDASREDEKRIVDNISIAALKSIAKTKGALINIKTENPLRLWNSEQDLSVPEFMREMRGMRE